MHRDDRCAGHGRDADTFWADILGGKSVPSPVTVRAERVRVQGTYILLSLSFPISPKEIPDMGAGLFIGCERNGWSRDKVRQGRDGEARKRETEESETRNDRILGDGSPVLSPLPRFNNG